MYWAMPTEDLDAAGTVVNRDAVRLPTRAGAVADRIRQLIKTGELPPGTHLRQAEFAERFGVSTTPVREAFVALAQEGLVRQDAHRGVVVFAPSTDELREVYEIRSVLEPLATELAATQLSDADLGAIERIVTQMRNAKPKRYFELNRDLHSRIYAGARRPRLHEIIDGLREPSASYIGMNFTQYDQEYRDEVQAEHEAILDALRARAPKRAARAMREHLEHSARHVAALVEEAGGSGSTPSGR
jgi:DNA-binding GntR family transcriptional regulator